jgi:hypothetical protein
MSVTTLSLYQQQLHAHVAVRRREQYLPRVAACRAAAAADPAGRRVPGHHLRPARARHVQPACGYERRLRRKIEYVFDLIERSF